MRWHPKASSFKSCKSDNYCSLTSKQILETRQFLNQSEQSPKQRASP